LLRRTETGAVGIVWGTTRRHYGWGFGYREVNGAFDAPGSRERETAGDGHLLSIMR
jgi:hypothetical protein